MEITDVLFYFIFALLFFISSLLPFILGIFYSSSKQLSMEDVNKDNQKDHTGISLVICNHNGLQHLKNNIDSWLHQDNENLQIIIVDDHSSDGSLQYLQGIKHPRLEVIKNTNKQGKKFAQNLGISAAQHEKILLTDVDSSPQSALWSDLAAQMLGEKELLLLYAPYRRKSGLLNALVRFETTNTALSYFGASIMGIAYMAVGRNMAVKKSSYLDNANGSYFDLPYGDDDLLVSAVAKSSNTAIILHRNSWTWSDAPDTWKQWWNQKSRHLSTGKQYKWYQKLYLTLYPFSIILFYALLAFMPQDILISSLFARTLGLYLFTLPIYRQFRNLDVWVFLPLFEIAWIFYLTTFSPFIFFINKKKW